MLTDRPATQQGGDNYREGLPRNCSSCCRIPNSRSCEVLRCEASTREDSTVKLLENLSICSMMPFRDLKDYQGVSPWGLPGLTNPLGKQHQAHTYRVWEVALVTASISWSFSTFNLCSWCSWSLRISRMDALGEARKAKATMSSTTDS